MILRATLNTICMKYYIITFKNFRNVSDNTGSKNLVISKIMLTSGTAFDCMGPWVYVQRQ